MAFDLPVIGQELLAIQVVSPEPLRIGATGTFAQRLRIDVKNSTQKKLLNKFYAAVGRLLILLNSKGEISENESWKYVMKEGEAFFTYKLKSGESFVLKAFDYSGHFRRLRFALSGKQRLSLDLFVSQCSL